MNIGSLNTRCRIEQKVIAYDSTYGTETVTWSLLAVVWCNVQDVLPSRSTEVVTNGVALAMNKTRVRMRYRTDVDGSMRFVISRPSPITYQIIAGPAELGSKDGIEFVVERVSS